MKTKFSRFTLSILIASMFAIAVTTLAGCSLLKKYRCPLDGGHDTHIQKKAESLARAKQKVCLV